MAVTESSDERCEILLGMVAKLRVRAAGTMV
jgi:hypothetical protein